MSNSVPWDELDVGVRGVVRLLNENGFETCDSGDGKSKFGEDGKPLPEWKSDNPDFEWVMDIPHVAMGVPADRLAVECDRLLEVLTKAGVKVDTQGLEETPTIQGTYDPAGSGPGGNKAWILLLHVNDALLQPPLGQ